MLDRRSLMLSALALGGVSFTAMAQTPPHSYSSVDLLVAGPLGDRVMGSDKAPVTLIEYASMTCTHCAHFHLTTYPQLKSRYIEPGHVRYILREYPFDPLAMAAFMLARCAPEEHYFAIIELLFQTQVSWMGSDKPADALFEIVKQAGFTKNSFEACLKDQKLVDGINAVRERGGKEFGVNATPTFFLNGEKISGMQSIEELAKKIDPLLKA